MTWYEDFLKKFFHDPIDKPFDIKTHETRAKNYAEFFGISNTVEGKFSDIIASCMERSLLPKEKVTQKFNEVRHPLSDEKITVDLDDENSINTISNVMKEISNSYKDISNDKKVFLIWRNLLEDILEKVTNEELKKFIPVLPADTRVPDHSIWEHLKVTTAINAFENIQNNSLLLFTIGPVQSFISQARKTQDFYMGSFILSYLTFLAIEEVVEKFGPTSIIYPDLYKQPLMDWFLTKKKGLNIKNFDSKSIQLPTIPNRFVAIIGDTDKNHIGTLVKLMKDKVKNELEDAYESIFNGLRITLNKEQKEILQRQLSDFPQIFWVAIPWKKGNDDLQIDDLKEFFSVEKVNQWKELINFAIGKGEHHPNVGFLYQLIYTALEKSMGAVKNLRIFEQLGEAGRKCSICGERNVLFFSESKNKNKFLRYNPNAVNLTDKIAAKFLADGEGLCALCFLKRTFEIYLEKRVDEVFKDFTFPSTAEVACADFKEKAKDLKEFKDYEKCLKSFPKISSLPKLNIETVEGYWMYKENFNKKKIKEELGEDLSQEEIKELTNKLDSIYRRIGKPNPYYAIIHLDGDDMGKWLSGEMLPVIQYAYNSQVWEKLPEDFKNGLTKISSKKVLTPAIHSAVSVALRNYAIEFVRKIVEEEHLGKLIYAGGDDVLAFVNLKDLFDVMEKLRWAFSGHIKIESDRIKVDITNNSVFVLKNGFYHLTMGKYASCSMGVVIAHYKEPLKIVIDKVFEMGNKAKEDGKNKFAICLLKRSGEQRVGILEWIVNEKLTTAILKGIKEKMDNEKERYISDGFIQKFRHEFLKLIDVSEGIIETELERLIFRAYNGKKGESKDDKKEFVKEFANMILSILTTDNLPNCINLLEIASFMNRGD